ncbi:MAG: pyrroloquinoline quinone biosynthesis peptide chaperone PqqD [Hyphomicrobiaceae bacterium]
MVRTRLIVDATTAPKMPRHIKLRHDTGRDRWLILAPERVFDPDEISVAVLKLCNGERTVEAIADQLSIDYQAPKDVILSDIIEMLQDLADKGVVQS